jgi:bifunctional UDP-N-acetylglucosamine pyrophosphorylase/glucosamine-1-phosphate N-acetyltransferase
MKILILAAGNSKRFESVKSKVLTNFWGVRVIDIIQAQANSIGPVCTIVNEKIANEIHGEKIIQDTKFAYGTGAAVIQYYNTSQKEEDLLAEDLLVIPGDIPLIDSSMLKKFINQQADIVIGCMKMPTGPEQYGRIIIENGKIKKIAEYKTHLEKTEYANTGIMLIKQNATKLIPQLQKNEYGEVYLTHIVQKAYEANMAIDMVELSSCALGFNTMEEFHILLKLAQQKWQANAILSGAIFYDKETTYLSYDTKFEPGAVIEPFCSFGPAVELKSNAHIKTFSVLSNCVADGIIGPFAHIRSGEIEKDAQVGAFVEISKSIIKKGAKMKHLAYIGNAYVGSNSNISAGTIVCNYDGKNKHQTIIESNAFIGANTSLIAPINIKAGAFLAAGGVYTNNVEENEFAIARSRQTNKKACKTIGSSKSVKETSKNNKEG